MHDLNKTLSFPSMMVWQYFQALRRLCDSISLHKEHEKDLIQQDAAISVILAVTGVEIFMNLYFRVLVDEPQFSHATSVIVADLERQVPFETKLKIWPLTLFGQKLNLGQGIGQQFVELKALRNKLIHFSSSHEMINLPGVTIQGMADTSVYSSLTKNSASSALEIAECFILEVFRLRGLGEQNALYGLHKWTGKAPNL